MTNYDLYTLELLESMESLLAYSSTIAKKLKIICPTIAEGQRIPPWKRNPLSEEFPTFHTVSTIRCGYFDQYSKQFLGRS